MADGSPGARGSMMRNLGAFFGHIARAVREPVEREELRRDRAERRVPVPGGVVTLRRTVVEEIEVRPGEPSDEARNVHVGDRK